MTKIAQTGLTKPKLIQLIHIAKSQLALDESTYRANLIQLTGKDSTKSMTHEQLRKVFEDLKTKGFKTTPAKGTNFKKESSMAKDDQSKLIRHLWLSLHGLGEVKNSSEQALAKYVERQTGVSALQWLTMAQASMVIESLKKWELRILKPRAITVLSAIQNKTLDHTLISSDLLKWLIATSKGKYKGIAESDYVIFIQTYSQLTT